MIQILATAAAHESTLPFPPIIYAVVALAIFTFMGFIVWSFRDVANRHSHKTGGDSGHAGGHTTAEHD